MPYQAARQPTGSLFSTLVGVYAAYLLGLLIIVSAVMSLVLLVTAQRLPSADELLHPAFGLTLAGIGAVLLYLHQREGRFGSVRHLLGALSAEDPCPDDQPHAEFARLVEAEAAKRGVDEPRIKVLPTHAVTLLSLMDETEQPLILVSEGLLAQANDEEIRAGIAHQLASIASPHHRVLNMLAGMLALTEDMGEKATPSLEHVGYRWGTWMYPRARYRVAGNVLFWWFHGIMRRVLGWSIAGRSRSRILNADADAAERTNPGDLAKLLYKAHEFQGSLGSYSTSYAPMALVAACDDGATSPQPPVVARIRRLAEMARTTAEALVREVWQQREERERERPVLDVAPAEAADEAKPARHPKPDDPGARIYELRHHSGAWIGPFTAAELVAHPDFMPQAPVRSHAEDRPGGAIEFPSVLAAFEAKRSGHSPEEAQCGEGCCPRGHGPLEEEELEGVRLMTCPRCRGRCVASRQQVSRIIAREGVAFSPALVLQARSAAEALMVNTAKLTGRVPQAPRCVCPECARMMSHRPYSYQFFLPIDECLHCGAIWFDANELEFLQIWHEERRALASGRDEED